VGGIKNLYRHLLEEQRYCESYNLLNHGEGDEYQVGEGLDAVQDQHRIVGFKDLQELLQPVHPYFANKRGFIENFTAYQHHCSDEAKLLYPKVKAESKDNPYKKMQLARSHTGRTVGKMEELAQVWGLEDLKMEFLTLTFPKEISEWIVAHGRSGREMAWRLFERFWNDDFQKLDEKSSGRAAHVNLHLWKTQNPTLPHVHFHVLAPNYRVCKCEDDEPDVFFMLREGDCPMELVERRWHKQRGGRFVPYSEEGLRRLKGLWWARVRRFARRKRITWVEYRQGEDGELEPNVNLYIQFVGSITEKRGRVDFMHKLNYCKRSPLEDYAKYSNRFPDCPNLPEWLEGYTNRPRVYGFWRDLRAIIQPRGLECSSPEILEIMANLDPEALARRLVNYSPDIRGDVLNKLSDEVRRKLKSLIMGLMPVKGVEKYSPFTGELMFSSGKVFVENLDRLAVESGLRIGGLSFYKGRPQLYDLSPDDMAWLRSVEYQP